MKKNKSGNEAERLCICCGRKFLSKGIYNRKCEKCKRNHKQNPKDYYLPKEYKYNINSDLEGDI